MISLGVLIASVVATTLAMLATHSARLAAAFCHRLLLVAIVLAPLGTLAVGTLLPIAGGDAGFAPGLMAALSHLDFRSVGDPARLAVASATRYLPLHQLYLAVSLVLLLRMALEALRTNRRVRKARELTCPRLGGHQGRLRVTIRKAEQAGSPFAWGVVRPVIVVPSAWGDWPRGKRIAVISHESAHIRRCDVLTTSLSLLACCLLWINPMIWFAHRRLRQQAERACDDHVVNRGVEAPRYASYLVEIARSANPGPAPAMVTQSTLSRRVNALLNPHTRRLAMPKRYTLITLATAFVVMSGSAAVGGLAAEEAGASAATRLKACGQLLPPDSRFVMELSANWNTAANPQPEDDFELTFTFGDKDRPDLVGEVPPELHPFAQCLSKALMHRKIDLSDV